MSPNIICNPDHIDRKFKAKGMCVQCYSKHQGEVKKARRHAVARRMLHDELLPGAKKRNHKRTGKPIGGPRIHPLPLQKQPISQEALDIASTNPEITVESMQEVLAPKVERDELGRILPGGPSLTAGLTSPAKKMAAWIRAKLGELDPTDKQGRTRMEVMFLNLYAIASSGDSKTKKESIWAWNALLERGLGKPLKDQSELDAIKESGTKFIIMTPPLIDNSIVPKPLELSTTPEFDADGYEVS